MRAVPTFRDRPQFVLDTQPDVMSAWPAYVAEVPLSLVNDLHDAEVALGYARRAILDHLIQSGQYVPREPWL